MNLYAMSIFYSYAKGANIAAMTFAVWTATTAGACMMPFLHAYQSPAMPRGK